MAEMIHKGSRDSRNWYQNTSGDITLPPHQMIKQQRALFFLEDHTWMSPAAAISHSRLVLWASGRLSSSHLPRFHPAFRGTC